MLVVDCRRQNCLLDRLVGQRSRIANAKFASQFHFLERRLLRVEAVRATVAHVFRHATEMVMLNADFKMRPVSRDNECCAFSEVL